MKSTPIKYPRTVARAAALCAAAMFLGACAGQPKNAAGDVKVKIKFDGQGCPTSATPEVFNIEKGNRIAWQAVGQNDKPVATTFRIYFDPFKGRPLKSNRKGFKRSPPFNKKSPALAAPDGIEYKYSIVGGTCEHQPLDPRFRLRK